MVLGDVLVDADVNVVLDEHAVSMERTRMVNIRRSFFMFLSVS